MCQPKAKLSAQLSDTVWGGEWGGLRKRREGCGGEKGDT